MRQKIYSIYDKKALDHQGVTLAPNDAVAVRWLREGIRGSGTQMEKFPEDFSLHCLGELDTESGVIVPEPGGRRDVYEIAALFVSPFDGIEVKS